MSGNEQENVGAWNEDGNPDVNDDGVVSDYGVLNEGLSDDGSHEQFPEEARVEREVADFIDEEENDNYMNTPPGSDGEEEAQTEQYIRWKKGSGELRLKQVFMSIEEFKEAIMEYVLKEGWNVKYTKWGNERCTAVSGKEDDEHTCLWRIYCSYEKPAKNYMVKTYVDEHTCVKDGYSKILKQDLIAKLFLNDVRYDPLFKPSTIQHQIQQRWNLIATIDQCKKAKAEALKIIHQEHEEQFSKLKNYKLEILDKNPGSSVHLDTFPVEGQGDIFHRFYVCFDVLKRTWRQYCRPIIGIDGCFLKCTTKGQLLAAIGRDANNQMYPVAWAVVDVEDKVNWLWFIQKLKVDLHLGNGEGFTIISDRQKGLLLAVEQELPRVEHRMCARHIYGNLKRLHPNKPDMKGFFWKVAKSYNKASYERKLEAVKRYDMSVYEAMMQKNPKNCSRAFFSSTASCDDVHNNISESFNHAINPAREMPMVEMLETIWRRAMSRIEIRYKKAMKHTGRFSLKAILNVALEKSKMTYCRVLPGSDGWFEVKNKSQSYRLNMRRHTYTCRMWEMSGIPCRHALKVIAKKKWEPQNYISHWYSTSMWRNIYSESIMPMEGSHFWRKSGSTHVMPPPRDENLGRKPNPPKRKRGLHESPTKKTKVTRYNRIIHCGNCGQPGHKATTCKNVGTVNKWPAKKKKNTPSNRTEGETDSMSVPFGESSSQPTQNSVAN